MERRIKVATGSIECGGCGKQAKVRQIEHSDGYFFVQIPTGWFADLGLSDSGQAVCSPECVRSFIRNPFGFRPMVDGVEAAEVRAEIAKAETRAKKRKLQAAAGDTLRDVLAD